MWKRGGKPPSGFYGVYASGKRWKANITYDAQQHNLGNFGTKQEAALAYDRAARQCGEDKPLNSDSIEAAEEAAEKAKARMDLPSRKRPRTGDEEARPRPSSGFYGVCASRKRWIATIRSNSKVHNLGTFGTKQEAALAYDRAARQCAEGRPLNYESIKAAEEAAVQAQAVYILAHPKQPKPRPPSGFYGVSASGKRWRVQLGYHARVTASGKTHTKQEAALSNLGCFDTKQEAALAYDRAARQCADGRPLNYESIKTAEEAAVHAQAAYILAHPKQPKPRPPSGFYGVYASGKRWKSYIRYDSKQHTLGYFDTKQEAALAYDRKARQCGEDKPLNYESIKAAEEAAVQAQAGHILVHNMMSAGPQQPKPRPASGFYGVSASRKRWKAQIGYDGKQHNLGTFGTKQEAALAYDRAARQCREDKQLNYESIKTAEEAAVHT
jgi:hypothetical protein